MKLLIVVLGITIAYCIADSHVDVIDDHLGEDPFHELLHSALGEEAERGYFNNEEIDNVLNISKNRFPEHQCVLKLSLNVTNEIEWGEDEIKKLSRRIIFAIISNDDCPEYSDVNHGNLCHEDMVKILHDFRSYYHSKEDSEQCFNAFTISDGGCVDSDEVNLILFRHIYMGHCLYPTQDDIIEDLREHLNVTEDDVLYKTDFEQLLSHLKIAKKAEEEDGHDDHGHGDDHADEDDHEGHDHEGEDHEDHEEEHDDHAEEHDDHDHEGEDHEDHDDHEEDHDDHAEEHDDHDHEGEDHEDHDDHEEGHDDEEHSRRRRAADDEHHEHVSTCLEAQGFYDIFQVKENISWAKFVEMSPAILQQVFTGACNAEDHHDEKTTSDGSYTTAQKYGYGTLSVLLISLLALVGLLVIPLMGKLAYDGVMQFFVALGISSLFTDAVVHILPFVLGIHVHGVEDEHDHEEEENNDYIWKLSVVAAGVYFFFLLECLLRKWHAWRIVANMDPASDMGKDHDHETRLPGPTIGGNAHVYGARASVQIYDNHYVPTEDIEKAATNDKDVIPYLGITPVCLMIFIGDVLHNFGDGLAIGVSFSVSISAGIGTSLAVFCHELPHEFGDFAIYLSNGASKKKAIVLNVMAALCALIGLYIGIAVASDIAIRQWLLAIIAGMFLYISLVDVLHEVIEAVPRRSMGIFLVQNIGMLLGWAALMLLALYEEDLSNAVSN